MMRCGNYISQEHHPFATVVEHHHLVTLSMAVGDDRVQARHDLCITVQQFQLTSFFDGQKILRPVGTMATFVGITRFTPARILNVVFSLWESWHQVASSVQPSASARMVKMQVGKNHRTNIFRS